MNARGLIRTFSAVVMLATASAQRLHMHDQMTDEEFAKMFHTTRDNMPQYDVAMVRHNHYKSFDRNLRLKFTAFGEKIDAYLNPWHGQLMGANTPVWLAFTTLDGTVKYKKMRDGIVGIVTSRFFASSGDLSTVAVTQRKGEHPSFNGLVGGMLIRPLPKRFQEEARSRRNSEAPDASRMKLLTRVDASMLDSHYHVIIKSTSMPDEEKIKRLEKQFREASRSGKRTDDSRAKRSNAEIIYPSVLVQTDYNVSKTTENDLDHDEEILYQLAYWNAVDLRFRQVDNPKIRLCIVGIIIGQHRTATPYLENSRSGDVIDVHRLAPILREYWYNMSLREDFPEEAYDIVVTLTDTELMFKGQRGEGMASRSFCLKNKSTRSFHGVAIARDRGGFDGVLVTAHELGHVLGLDHDRKSYDDKCAESNGFIMSTKNKLGPKKMEWSPCSLAQFSHFLRLSYIDCYDQPADFYLPGNPIQKLLPGDVWGPHKQCQARLYDGACDPSPDMCTQMRCFNTHLQPSSEPRWRCQNVGPAAEGTLCAPGHKCVDGVCKCMTNDCIYKN